MDNADSVHDVTGNSEGISFEPPPLQAPPVGGSGFAPPSPAPPFVAAIDAPQATVVPTGTVGKRSKGKVFGGLAVVVALVGAGGFAVSRIVAGNDGGAANPTEVGTRLMDALAAEDVLGVVDLLLPGERDMMRQPLIDMVDHLKRLGVADSTANLEKVGGFDIAFTDVQVDPSPTNVDDVSDIRITATGSVSMDGQKVPIGPLVLDEAFGGKRPDLGNQTNKSDIDWKLATVKHDGRWYLSAFYSVAENVRKASQDVPEKPVTAHGSDTPDGAVQAILDAVDDLDLEALIAALNPNEAEALQRYAPMFIDDAQKALDKLDVKIAFTDTKFSVVGTGDRRTVSIDGLKMHFTNGDTDVTFEGKDGCAVMTINDTTTDTCANGNSIDTAIKALGLDDNDDVKALVKTVREAFSDMKPVGFTVQKVGGKWFLSPIGTYLDLELTVMAALDQGELTDIIDGIKKVAKTLSADGIFGLGTDGGGVYPPSDGSGASGLDACYQQSEYAAFSACVTSGLADGSIDPTDVPPYFRFADCGVGEKYFDASIYSMSDAEFTAFATGAAPCFQKYVADGSISQFELPYELSRPDCLEGKNWYNQSDPAYTDRLFACAT